MLGGEIQVTSSLDIGSCFTVILPVEYISKPIDDELFVDKNDQWLKG